MTKKARKKTRPQDRAMVRMIDANSNRVREGVRVCEDIARFILDNRKLVRALKNVRHAITASVALLPLTYADLLNARASGEDVGNDLVVFAEGAADAAQLFIANMKRAQEGVRVLEECAKQYSRQASRSLQGVRFKLYTIETEMLRYEEQSRTVAGIQ